MPRTLTCADCGKPMAARAGSKPQGEARCHECRRANPAPKRQYRYADTRKREPKPKPIRIPKEPHDCPICGTSTLRPVYCSPECSTERVRRDLRDRYRSAHGLPVDPNRPVKSRTRLQAA